MAARLQSLIKKQQELLGDISHELRSPLTRMNVSLELARRGDASGLAKMQEEIGKLETLIAQLLTLTRLDLRSEQELDQRVPLRPLLESIVQDANFEGAPQQKSVVITSAADCAVLGDPALLRSCIENVVRNAIRYTPGNSSVEASLHIFPAGAGSSAELRVCDHGPGVPEEVLAKLTEPFFRVSESRDRNSGVSGLGLSIAQRVALLRGGSIQVANAAGGGLEVRFTFPVVK